MKILLVSIYAALVLIVLNAGCAGGVREGGPDDGARERAESVFRASFTHGNREMAAKVDKQDEVQELCTRYRNEPPKELAEKIESTQAAAAATTATASRPPRSRTERSGRACTASARCAGRASRCSATSTARSTTPRPISPAPRCRASVTT